MNRTLLDHVVRIEKDGDAAIAAVDRNALTAVIDEAASIKLASPKIAECQTFRDRIDEINVHLDQAREAVVEQQMLDALQEAIDINLQSSQRDNCQ